MNRLSVEERAVIGQQAARASWPGGFQIYERGAPADGVFIVLAGCVTLRSRVRSGRAFVPSIVTPGQTFGAEGLAMNGTYVTDARADEASDTLFLSNARMRALLRETPAQALALVAQVMAERSELLDRLREVMTTSVEHRLLSGLQRMNEHPGFKGSGGRVELCNSRYRMLCELVGATRESVSLVMGKLVAEELAERSGSTLFVPVTQRLVERLSAGGNAGGLYSGFTPATHDAAPPS